MTKTSGVEATLRELIATMKQGDRVLSERAIAETYGVSRGTAREALRKLEEEGMVKRVPVLGTFVERGKVVGTDFPPQPTDEARLAALEKFSFTLAARIEQMSIDMLASFRAQAMAQAAFERHVDERFDAVHAELAEMQASMGRGFNMILGKFEEIAQMIEKGK